MRSITIRSARSLVQTRTGGVTFSAIVSKKEVGFRANGQLWLLNAFGLCLWSSGTVHAATAITWWPHWHRISFIPRPAYPAQLRDQGSDQKWQLISSVIWWWNRWEWKERGKKKTGCIPGSIKKKKKKKAWWLLHDRSSCPQCNIQGKSVPLLSPPSPWQLSQTPLPLPSGAQRTERPEWENSYIYNFFLLFP